MQRATTLAAYAVFGILVIWGLVRGFTGLAAMILMFVNSPLPWWILAPAAVALIVGFFFLFRIRLARKSPNRKFVH